MAKDNKEPKVKEAKEPVAKVEKKDASKKRFIFAVGRRREAVARVRLYEKGTGLVTINGKPGEEYFASKVFRASYTQPFRITNTYDKFDMTVKIVGGGSSGQLGAMIHGIARALEKFDTENFRPILKKQGFMTRDPRAKERRKAGFAHKARARKQSPKR